jgi:hypothetical protein
MDGLPAGSWLNRCRIPGVKYVIDRRSFSGIDLLSSSTVRPGAGAAILNSTLSCARIEVKSHADSIPALEVMLRAYPIDMCQSEADEETAVAKRDSI